MAHEDLQTKAVWSAAADDDENTLDGYASVFGNVDGHGDVVVRGAFKRTIRERVAAGRVKLLDGHATDSRSVLGTVVAAEEDDRGLRIRARLSTAPSVQETKQKMIEGHLSGLSIGHVVPAGGAEWKAALDGRTVRHLKEVKLFEVSVTAVPANELAGVLTVKGGVHAAEVAAVTAADRLRLLEEEEAAIAELARQDRLMAVGLPPDLGEAVVYFNAALNKAIYEDYPAMIEQRQDARHNWYIKQYEDALADARRRGDWDGCRDARDTLKWLDRRGAVLGLGTHRRG